MEPHQPTNTFNHLPIFEDGEDVLDHERESIAVYDLASKKMIAYNLTSGWVEFATKKPIESIHDIDWVYIEEMATTNEEAENHSASDSSSNHNPDVIIPELITPQ